MREGFGNDSSLALLLQAVIADLCSGIQRLLDLAGFNDVFGRIGTISPDAGEAVGLQFEAYR